MKNLWILTLILLVIPQAMAKEYLCPTAKEYQTILHKKGLWGGPKVTTTGEVKGVSFKFNNPYVSPLPMELKYVLGGPGEGDAYSLICYYDKGEARTTIRAKKCSVTDPGLAESEDSKIPCDEPNKCPVVCED